MWDTIILRISLIDGTGILLLYVYKSAMHAMKDCLSEYSTPYRKRGVSIFFINAGLFLDIDVELSVLKNSSTDSGKKPHLDLSI